MTHCDVSPLSDMLSNIGEQSLQQAPPHPLPPPPLTPLPLPKWHIYTATQLHKLSSHIHHRPHVTHVDEVLPTPRLQEQHMKSIELNISSR